MILPFLFLRLEKFVVKLKCSRSYHFLFEIFKLALDIKHILSYNIIYNNIICEELSDDRNL